MQFSDVQIAHHRSALAWLSYIRITTGVSIRCYSSIPPNREERHINDRGFYYKIYYVSMIG